MQLNNQSNKDQPRTHEGGPASRISPAQELRRSVMACMLWEDTFYEDGKDIARRIAELVPLVDPDYVASIAVAARNDMKLRHIPLLLCRELARNKTLKAQTLTEVIQRPDELTEFMAIYWKDGREKISSAVKRGLAAAFNKFNAYSLAKYNRYGAVKLRDVMFLTHPKPKDYEQAATWKQLVDGTLPTPDTWEVALSTGEDKKATWERLLMENKLGALALLRNLRNMQLAGVDISLIKSALLWVDKTRVLPYRFIAAAKYMPRLEPDLEQAMFDAAPETVLKGSTTILVDCSASMSAHMSIKSRMRRLEAAVALCILGRELCENVRIFTFSDDMREVPPRRGFALRDAIGGTRGGTRLWTAVAAAPDSDRLIVITDEQTADRPSRVNSPHVYMINVGSYQNGVGYNDKYLHLDGFSEAVFYYMAEYERTFNVGA